MGKMMTACTMMQELGGGILKASKMWNFANCDFVYKGARGTNARIVAASKLIHQLATQFENIKSQVMRLSAKSSWLLEETKKAVDRLAKGFEHTYQEQLTKAVEIVSHILIINSILGGGDGAPAETKWPKVAEKWVLHCQRTLNFPSGRLDKTLLKKIKWGRKNDTIDTDTAKKPEKTQQQEDDATRRNKRMMRRRRNTSEAQQPEEDATDAAGSTDAVVVPPAAKKRFRTKG
jgi:rubredoxin